MLTFVPPDTISRMPVISTGFRGFARRQGLKASSMGRASRVVRATSKSVATDSSRKWCLTAICSEAPQGGRLARAVPVRVASVSPVAAKCVGWRRPCPPSTAPRTVGSIVMPSIVRGMRWET